MPADSLPKKVEVVAYSGYKANERPVYFIMDDKRLEVSDVIDKWYGMENDYFKVVAEDGRIYVLRWHRHLDLWFMVKVFEGMGKH